MASGGILRAAKPDLNLIRAQNQTDFSVFQLSCSILTLSLYKFMVFPQKVLENAKIPDFFRIDYEHRFRVFCLYF